MGVRACLLAREVPPNRLRYVSSRGWRFSIMPANRPGLDSLSFFSLLSVAAGDKCVLKRRAQSAGSSKVAVLR